MDKYFGGELLQGENAYQCDKCQRKVATVRRACIWKAPKRLVCCLSRFEYDFFVGQRKKTNSLLRFDNVIDISEYMYDRIFKKETGQDVDSNDDFKASHDPKNDYVYDLCGVIIHSGSATRGHYYCFNKNTYDNRKHQWVEFNDTIQNIKAKIPDKEDIQKKIKK